MSPSIKIDDLSCQRLIWFGILFVYIFLRIQPIGIPIDRDEGVFGLIGRAILEGGLPYLDGIDHKPPLVFYIYAVILSILPASALGIHLFLHLYNLVTLYIVFLFTKRIADINTAYWVVFLYAILSINPFVQGFTASTEMFMLLPIMLSLLFALMSTEQGRFNNIYLALSGVLGALACWCKQPAVFSVFFAIIIIVVRVWQFQSSKSRFQNIIKAVLIWLAGGITTSLLIVIYFTMNGILDDFFYWSFQHSLLYSSGLSILDRFTMGLDGLLRIVTNSPLVFVFSFCAMFIKHDNLDLKVWLFLLFFLLSLIGVSIGFAYPHYYAQIILPLVLLAGISCARITTRVVNTKFRHIMTSVIAAAFVLIAIVPNTNYHLSSDREGFSRQFFGHNPFPESIYIANYLKKNTDPEDKIFIFGSEPQILLLSERSSATEFYVIYPLMRSDYPQHIKFQERAISGIKESRPKYIIRVLLSASLLYDGKAELKISDFLDDYLNEHYQLENILFFSEEKQAWLPYKHNYFQQGGKRSDVSIIFNRRIVE